MSILSRDLRLEAMESSIIIQLKWVKQMHPKKWISIDLLFIMDITGRKSGPLNLKLNWNTIT